MQLTIDLPGKLEPMTITGPGERNLKILRETLGVTLTSRSGKLKLSGETGSVGLAAGVLEKLRLAAEGGKPMSRAQLLDEITSAASRSEQEQNRARRAELEADPDQIESVLRDGAQRAESVMRPVVARVRDAVGL